MSAKQQFSEDGSNRHEGYDKNRYHNSVAVCVWAVHREPYPPPWQQSLRECYLQHLV